MAKIQTVSIAASRRLEVFQKKILINAKILKKKQKNSKYRIVTGMSEKFF